MLFCCVDGHTNDNVCKITLLVVSNGYDNFLSVSERLEDINGVIRSRYAKDRQYNGGKTKEQNTTHKPH
jgi:hypothetical protein